MYKKIILFCITFLLLAINPSFANNENGTGIIINNSSELGYDGRIITLFGENFGTGGEVIVNGGTFTKIEWSDKKIVGKLPMKLIDTNIYIQKNNEKSNIYKLNIKLPHIDYIYGKEGFYNGKIVSIHGKNLDHYKTTQIKIDDKIIEGDYKNFQLNNLTLTKHKISIISGGYESNTIEFDVYSDNIILKSIYQKYTNGNKFLELNFNKTLTNTSSLILYNNDNIVNISKFQGKSIILENYTLNNPNNFYKLKMNNTYSNVLNFKNTNLLPKIISLNFGSSFGSNKINDKRIIDLFILNFNKDKDTIYYNNSPVEIISCEGNTCRVLIPYNSYSGYFTVGNNPDKFIYDISYDNLQFINTINISGNLKKGTEINILGSNLLNTTISSENLFFDNHIFYSYGNIKGIVSNKYDSSKESSITFTSPLGTKTITFSGASFINNTIYGPAIIKDLKTDKKDTLFYPGTKINIIGKGFHKGDIISIGEHKIKLDTYNNTFTIPKDIKSGEYKLNIENKYGIKSDDYSIIILENNYKDIYINSNKIDNKVFFTNKNYREDKIYSINIENKITDVIIKKIQFNIENYIKEDYLGTFTLKLDGKEIGKALINDKGEIIFKKDIKISKDIKNKEISLYKDSIYINPGNYLINLDEKALDIFYSNGSYKKVKDIIISTKPYNIKVNNTEIIKCYSDTTINNSNSNNNCKQFNNTDTLNNIKDNKKNELNIDKPTEKQEIKKDIPAKEVVKIEDIKLSVANFNKSLVFKNLILSKNILNKDRLYKKYIKEIDLIMPILAQNDTKMVNLYNKLVKLTDIKGSIGNVIRYLKAKVDYEILNNDNIIKIEIK